MVCKLDIENLDKSHHADILFILRNNEENLTENINGFFFDLTKIGEKSISDLEILVQKINVANEYPNDIRSMPSRVDVNEATEITKDSTKKSTNLLISQKFINEYNTDFNKAQEKGTSLIKFLNAKKKYQRNLETSGSKNEPDLKKDTYVLV
jgi:hypothetical protein